MSRPEHTPRRREPGAARRIGGTHSRLQDPYHVLLAARWHHVIGLVAITYLALNALFATLYVAVPDCVSGARPGSFVDAFFFSVQTFSTIGYGQMAPHGTYGSVIVTLEAFVGLVTVAMATGMMFAKFAKPTARILFAEKMVMARRNGKPTLMFRAANERGNDLVAASFRLTILTAEVTEEGDHVRRLLDVPLLRGDTPLFNLAFLGMHVVDAASPMAGLTPEALRAGEVRFILTVTGLDATVATTVHARKVYHADDVVFDARFADVLSDGPKGELVLDYRKFHDVEPLSEMPRSA